MVINKHKYSEKSYRASCGTGDREGVPISDFDKQFSDRWIQGTVSDCQMIETLINAYKQM